MIQKKKWDLTANFPKKKTENETKRQIEKRKPTSTWSSYCNGTKRRRWVLGPLARRIRSFIRRRWSRRPCCRRGRRISAATLLWWPIKESRVHTARFDRGSRSGRRRRFGEVNGGHENALRRPPLVPARSLRHFAAEIWELRVRDLWMEEKWGETEGEIVRVAGVTVEFDWFFVRLIGFFDDFSISASQTYKAKSEITTS